MDQPLQLQNVIDVLVETRGNITKAAMRLGVSRPTLYAFLKRSNDLVAMHPTKPGRPCKKQRYQPSRSHSNIWPNPYIKTALNQEAEQ